jgi:hypothetical protein
MGRRPKEVMSADKLSTELQLEQTITDLKQVLTKREAELKKYKTVIEVETNPETQLHTVSVEVNGVKKRASFTPNAIDEYLKFSDPVKNLMKDILEIVLEPHKNVIISEINQPITKIVENRINQLKGTGL